MIGATMVAVSKERAKLSFLEENRVVHEFYHQQDCCERVQIEDICGDLTDLVGSPILMAEEVRGEPPEDYEYPDDAFRWTFYKFATLKGSVTVRWLGTSNGYYSMAVNYRCIFPHNTEMQN